jgi:hypothetical protein
MLPFIIGGAVVAGLVYLVNNSDEEETSSGNTNRDEKIKEINNEFKQEKNEKIIEEIMNYKKEMIETIEKKYNTIIYINVIEDNRLLINNLKNKINLTSSDIEKLSKIKIILKDLTIEEKINKLKKENEKISQALKELEDIKNGI